jgi:Flp pilus assembly protein TadG
MFTKEYDMKPACIPPIGLRRQRASRRGTAAVEFALTVPILLLFLFATLAFGRYNMIQQTVNNAAFAAARHCIVPGATVADGQTAGAKVLSEGFVTGGSVTITPNPITTTTAQVTATVTAPISSNLWVTQIPGISTNIFSGTASKTFTMTADLVDSSH